jgi:hypothetical protein
MNGLEIEGVRNLFEGIKEIGVDEWVELIKKKAGNEFLINIEGIPRQVSVDELMNLLGTGTLKDARIYLGELEERIDGKIRIRKKGKGKVYAVWIDIDKDIKAVKGIYEKLPQATFLVFTGRHWALVWFLEDAIYEGKRDDFEDLKNLMLGLIDDNEIRQEMKSKHITNAMVRIPNTINSKTGNLVRWFKIGQIWKVEDLKKELTDRGASLPLPQQKEEGGEEEEKVPSFLNHCELAKFLAKNYDEDLRYEGWRFLSYFAVLDEETKEFFVRKSKEWERQNKDRVEQRTEKRLELSKKDIEKGGGFFYCSTISNFDVEDFQRFHYRLNFNPCVECKFRDLNRRAWELLKIPEGYELKNGRLYKGSKEIAVDFDLSKIEKIVISEEDWEEWIYVKDGEITREFSLKNEEGLRTFFGIKGNFQNFRDFWTDFRKEHKHLIYRKPDFSGYKDGVWKILWRDYFTPVVAENFDLSQRGDVEKWKTEWFNICDFVIREKDITTALMIGTALRFLKGDYWGFTPAIALLGEKGSGKTLRLKIINSLIRKPSVVDYHQMTSAFLSNYIGKIRGFITIDEFWTTGVEDERTLSLLGLLNISGKFTARGKYQENYNPILIAGEETSFRSWGKQGLNRRVLRLILRKDEEEKWKKYVDFYSQSLKVLEKNYGFLYEIAKKILRVESEIMELNLKMKVEEREHKEMIEKALRMFFALSVALGVCEIDYDKIYEFANLSQTTQEIASEKAIQQTITKILDVMNEIFEIKKRKSNIDLDEVFHRVPSATTYKKEISLILCDKWKINEFEDRWGKRKYIKNYFISRNTPLFKIYKGEGFISLPEFIKHIDEKRKKMREQYGEDIWKEIPNQKVADLVSIFFADDFLNDKNKDENFDDDFDEDVVVDDVDDDGETIYFD